MNDEWSKYYYLFHNRITLKKFIYYNVGFNTINAILMPLFDYWLGDLEKTSILVNTKYKHTDKHTFDFIYTSGTFQVVF